MPYNGDRIKNVLVCMPDKHLGDLVVSLPSIKALSDFYRGKGFSLVVDGSYKDIAEALGGIDNLFLYPRKLLKESPPAKRAWIFLNFVHKLRRAAPDVAIDLEGRHVSSLLTLFSGARLRVGRSGYKRAYLYSRKVDVSADRHRAFHYAGIAEAVTGRSMDGPFRLEASERDRLSLKKTLLEEGVEADIPVVCIHPGAGEFYKLWTSEGFAEIADWLRSEGLQVIFVGGDGDLDKLNSIRPLLKSRPFDLGGKLSLGELTALFELSALFIGNDSGPMHLAASVGAPVVALFSHSREKRWGPVSDNSAVLRGEEPCAECRRSRCEYEFKCIRTLSADDVKSAVQTLLHSKSVTHG